MFKLELIGRRVVLAMAVLLGGLSAGGSGRAQELPRPNIVLILVDNLGWGELGSYGGGVLRGTPTPRIDALAAQGLRLTNFNVESECVPTRSALMTGRHPLRSGTLRSQPAGQPQGLVNWEITLAELLSAQGYATVHYGKWHLGDTEGRFPTNQGFDEWYGIPRTDNEAMYTTSPGFDPKAAPIPYILEGRKGEPTHNVEIFDVNSRARLDAEVTKRTVAFIDKNARARKPFFAYVPITQVHFPALPHPDFKGRTGLGDFSDAVVEMDSRVGEILDGIKKAGIEDNTIVLFVSDNGPELRRPWRGFAGPWRSHYHTAFEGGIRTPFIMRWPGRVAPGRVSNDIVHILDIFPTLAHIVGAPVPTDRAMDGVDQTAFLLGTQTKSNREGALVYVNGDLHAAKWRDWKQHYWWQLEPDSGTDSAGAIRLEVPYLFNLLTDPREETDVRTDNSWVVVPVQNMVSAVEASLKKYPPIAPGTPDPYQPPR